jgi:hypothetical protein
MRTCVVPALANADRAAAAIHDHRAVPAEQLRHAFGGTTAQVAPAELDGGGYGKMAYRAHPALTIGNTTPVGVRREVKH